MTEEFENFLIQQSSRIIGQMDRDPDSPTYGCFDRNFWHYKIRDFASIILQQGILILDTLHDWEHPENYLYRDSKIHHWIKAGIDFWAKSQLPSGSFNEYYPFEQGFPPTAFSLYAVTLIYNNHPEFETSLKIKEAIQKCCNYLIKTKESEALNQESAALAGLGLASKIPGIEVDQNKLNQRIEQFLKSQSSEGWVNEYGGADVGYLSVTIDCLHDLNQALPSKGLNEFLIRATDYLSHYLISPLQTPAMVNSRNTDYIVPYGLACLGEQNQIASACVQHVIGAIDRPTHYLRRVDDRYACHYIFQSCFRSIAKLKSLTTPTKLPYQIPGQKWFSESGVFFKYSTDESFVCALKKGGIFYHFKKQTIDKCDFGKRVVNGKIIAVSHWQDSSYDVEIEEKDQNTTLRVRGQFSEHQFLTPSPSKHMTLRLISFFLGKRVIPWLKSIMIFKNKKSSYGFERTIELSNKNFTVEDKIENSDNIKVSQAPSYSLRHVASAGAFLLEDLKD